MNELSQWLGAIALLVSIVNTIAVWVTKGGRELAQKVDKLATDVDVQDSRVQRIESELKHLPSKEAFHELTLRVAEMNGKVGTTEAEVAGVSRTVRRIEDHLMGVRA